ncbi:M42 family metallopeptidase [Acidobacteria bacterium AH-259-A15]|nr:M42 family metallopeptidase [Acidobacteria bacterium AH-259-A15]
MSPKSLLFALLSLLVSSALSAQDPTIEMMRALTDAHGPSGYEGPVGKVVLSYLEPVVDEIRYDGLGSIIGVKKGSTDRPKVMIAAHMDEVGFMVKYIDEQGYIYMNPLGGWLNNVLLAQRWIIMTKSKGPILGISGSKTPHIMSPEERNRMRRWQEIFLDIGASSREEAMEKFGVRQGDPIAPHSPFTILNGTDLYAAKAWDDRVGLAVMIEVLRQLKGQEHPNTIYMVATTQEEIGLRGAQTSVATVQPDIGLSLEVGVAADYPGIGPQEAQELVGKGPGIFLHDNSMIPNLKFRDYIAVLAQRSGIPYQFEVLRGYGEDGSQIQRYKQGIPSVNLTVPTRYLHSHNGILSRRDFDWTVDLVVKLILSLDSNRVQQLQTFDYR